MSEIKKDPDLEAAYAELEAAVRKVSTLESMKNGDGRPGLLTDWVLIAALQGFDNDGIAETSIGYLVPPGRDIPWYRIMGLVEFSRQAIRNSAFPEEE